LDFWVEPKKFLFAVLTGLGFVVALIALWGGFDAYVDPYANGWGKQMLGMIALIFVGAGDIVRRL
jgi:hypothetical protein